MAIIRMGRRLAVCPTSSTTTRLDSFPWPSGVHHSHWSWWAHWSGAWFDTNYQSLFGWVFIIFKPASQSVSHWDRLDCNAIRATRRIRGEPFFTFWIMLAPRRGLHISWGPVRVCRESVCVCTLYSVISVSSFVMSGTECACTLAPRTRRTFVLFCRGTRRLQFSVAILAALCSRHSNSPCARIRTGTCAADLVVARPIWCNRCQ